MKLLHAKLAPALRSRAPLAFSAALLSGAAFLSEAAAQEDPLRFLRPSIEGEAETPAPPAAAPAPLPEPPPPEAEAAEPEAPAPEPEPAPPPEPEPPEAEPEPLPPGPEPAAPGPEPIAAEPDTEAAAPEPEAEPAETDALAPEAPEEPQAEAPGINVLDQVLERLAPSAEAPEPSPTDEDQDSESAAPEQAPEPTPPPEPVFRLQDIPFFDFGGSESEPNEADDADSADRPSDDDPGETAAEPDAPSAEESLEGGREEAEADREVAPGFFIEGDVVGPDDDAPGPGRDRAAVPAPAEVDERDRPLRFGMLAGRDIAATVRAVAPLSDALTRAIGRPVEVLPMSSYGAMIDAQATQRIDGGFYSAAAFAAAEALCRCLEPLVAPTSEDDTVAYHAIIVAWRGDDVTDITGLAGADIAVAAPDSVGARRMQLAGLLAEGIDPGTHFGSVVETESAEEAVRLLAAGEVDAAFAWSSLSGPAETGYSRGTLADLVRRGEVEGDDLAVIWRSPEITHGPVAVLRSLPDDDKQAIEEVLLSLYDQHPQAYDVLNPFYGGGYVAVEPDDYRGVALMSDQDVDAVTLPIAPAPAGVGDGGG